MEMTEQQFDRAYVEQMLGDAICIVHFMKVDGTERTMNVTKNPAFIHEDKLPSKNHKPLKSSSVVTVYDVDAAQWKSFILENLITIEKETV